MDNIINIKIEHIHPHPDNPRKDLGDLSEMVESIRKNGIMQNLSVIPDGNGEYTLIIGHRRHAAAVKAGLTELPCRVIEGLTKKEQVSIMLEENMQRNDLTILEQAQGFQMMLDLGETVDGIAEKTGFSKTTIYHRLNIGKLDSKLVREKEQDDVFQLSLKDLYLLEQIEDVEERNKVLKNASDSSQLAWKVRLVVDEQKRKKNEEVLIKLLFEAGVKIAPAKAESEIYGSKWETIKEFDLDKPTKRLGLGKQQGQLYFLRYGRWMKVIKERAKVKREKTPEEIAIENQKKNQKKIEAIIKQMTERTKQFVLSIISGQIPPVNDESHIKDLIWSSLIDLSVFIYSDTMGEIFVDESIANKWDSESRQKIHEAEDKFKKLGIIHQMLIALYHAMRNKTIVNYSGFYDKKEAQKLISAYAILSEYGWFFDYEELQVLDGSSELYLKAGD